MSSYSINFSDPLRGGFTINPGGFNGPGGTSSASNLRLYGRGALEWGEAVDEDLLRIAENLNGATPPPFGVGGQLWLRTKFYRRDTNGPIVYWYRLDPDNPAVWQTAPTDFLVNGGAGSATSNTAPAASIGAYWYTGAGPFVPATDAFGQAIKANTLYGYYSMFQQVPAGWVERTHAESTTPPVNGTDYPERNVLMYDEFEQDWTPLPISYVSLSTNPPPDPAIGAFWWETDSEQLNIWDGTSWVGIILSSGTQGWVGPNNFDMGGFRITNLANPVGAQDAATKSYTDSLASTAVLNSTYVRLAGTALNTPPNMTGSLAMDANPITGLDVQVYPAAPSNNAASIAYVNGLGALVGTPSSGSTGFANAYVSGAAVSHKPGDIYVNPATSHAWVAMTTAVSFPTFFGSSGSDVNWKQFFPAQWA